MSTYEERQYRRWAMFASVDARSEDNLYTGVSCDVSAGGIFVATANTPKEGTPVDVTVNLPEATLTLRGTVRWVRHADQSSHGMPQGCGIEWDELPIWALRVLLRFSECREPFLYE